MRSAKARVELTFVEGECVFDIAQRRHVRLTGGRPAFSSPQGSGC